MIKYIDKDALVAEINRVLNSYDPNEITSGRYALVSLRNFIDTIEVKEVDYERELSKYVSNGIHRFFPNVDDDYCKMDSVIWQDYVIETAKHFYELGLQARANKELVEEVYSHLDSIEDTADRMTSGNFMHNRAAIKFSANTIAKVLELIGLKTQKG